MVGVIIVLLCIMHLAANARNIKLAENAFRIEWAGIFNLIPRFLLYIWYTHKGASKYYYSANKDKLQNVVDTNYTAMSFNGFAFEMPGIVTQECNTIWYILSSRYTHVVQTNSSTAKTIKLAQWQSVTDRLLQSLKRIYCRIMGQVWRFLDGATGDRGMSVRMTSGKWCSVW